MKTKNKLWCFGALFGISVALLWWVLCSNRELQFSTASMTQADGRKGFRSSMRPGPRYKPNESNKSVPDRVNLEAQYNEQRILKEAAEEEESKKWFRSIGMPHEEVERIGVELRAIAGTLSQYFEVFHEWPQGGNREVAAALLGKDARKRSFLNWPETRVSQDGELLDPWQTPYYILVSGTTIEIRSAGPDRVLWNADDEYVK